MVEVESLDTVIPNKTIRPDFPYQQKTLTESKIKAQPVTNLLITNITDN